MIRLFVPEDLAAGTPVGLSAAQAHYLRDVMRRSAGDEVLLFNGRDGEWRSAIAALDRKGATAAPRERTRAQSPGADLELIVALVKRPRLETIAEKATELGAARIRLAVTRFTQDGRANLARLGAIAIEAAEQTGRLDVPAIEPPAKLDAILSAWGERPLIFCDEAGGGAPFADALMRLSVGSTPSVSILIGPEGGFSAEERTRLRSLSAVVSASLGPRILRADTAAIAALSLWQAVKGDWRP